MTSSQEHDPRQDEVEGRCAQCGKTRPISQFEAYFRVPRKERQYYSINHLEICDECMAQPHRPRRLRVLAGLATAKQIAAEEAQSHTYNDPTTGMTSKQKKEWKKQQKALRLAKHQPQEKPTPVAIERAVGESTVTNSAPQPVAAPAPAPRRDAYPDVLPAGATFIPVGFQKGKHTGLIIRLDPNNPDIDVEAKCLGHSEIQGVDVYHPHWEFYRDKARPNGLRPSCKALHRVTPDERQVLARNWKAEHNDQVEEGRRLEAEALKQAATAAEQGEPAPTTEQLVERAEQVMPLEIGSVDDAQKFAQTLSSLLPLVRPNVLANTRVTLPEGFEEAVGKKGYLDLESSPIDLAEVQRAGLFMLTQLADVMTVWKRYKKLELKYNERGTLLEQANDELRRMEVAMQEIEGARDRFKQDAATARAEAQPTRDQLAALREQYEQLKAKADLDHETLLLTEESNTNLAEQLKVVERLMKPFLGGRSLAQLIAESQAEGDGNF